MSLIPVTVEVSVPFDLHRFIIGQKGKDVREMMNAHDVNIKGFIFKYSLFILISQINVIIILKIYSTICRAAE